MFVLLTYLLTYLLTVLFTQTNTRQVRNWRIRYDTIRYKEFNVDFTNSCQFGQRSLAYTNQYKNMKDETKTNKAEGMLHGKSEDRDFGKVMCKMR